MKINVILAIAASLCVATANALPRKVFDEYHQNLSEGMTFEDEMAYYTDSKRKTVEELINTFTNQENIPKNQVKFRYSQRIQDAEDCKELSFDQESTLGRKSVLSYILKDTCEGDEESSKMQVVEMLYQGGWKINKIDIRD